MRAGLRFAIVWLAFAGGLQVIAGRGIARDVAHVRLERAAAAAGMVEVMHLDDGALARVERHASAGRIAVERARGRPLVHPAGK